MPFRRISQQNGQSSSLVLTLGSVCLHAWRSKGGGCQIMEKIKVWNVKVSNRDVVKSLFGLYEVKYRSGQIKKHFLS